LAAPRSAAPGGPRRGGHDGKTTLSNGRFLAVLTVACALGAAAVVGYVMLSRSGPPEIIAAATGPRGPAAPSREIDDGTWTDKDIRDCKSRSEVALASAAERRLHAVSADRVGLGGPGSEVMERAAYLLCIATRKPSHLCESYWRKQFIEAIKTYAADFRDVSSQAYWTNHTIAERASRNSGSDRTDWQTVTDDLRQTTRDMARLDEDIVAAFRSLIAEGIVNPDDFGVFLGLGIPPDIGRMIGDARPIADRCG
jgi:hypothetical protein